mgnify:FL=1
MPNCIIIAPAPLPATVCLETLPVPLLPDVSFVLPAFLALETFTSVVLACVTYFPFGLGGRPFLVP